MFIRRAVEPEQDDGEKAVDVVVDTIRSRYGNDALAMAEEQLAIATEDSADMWQSVVSRLRG